MNKNRRGGGEAWSSPARGYPVEPLFRSNTFAIISLHKSDRIRLLQFPAEEVAAVRQVIQQNWSKGLQGERTYAGSYEFQCFGNPWHGQLSDAIPARILVRELLAHLFAAGWMLTTSTGVCSNVEEKDTLIFRKLAGGPPPSSWIAISFNESDRLRLIGAPPDLIEAFGKLLRTMGKLQQGFWKESWNNAYEFQLLGKPWKPMGEETMATRLLILRMRETLENYGWTLYASIDQSVGSDGENGTDSWYCVKATGWVPGQSVFHL